MPSNRPLHGHRSVHLDCLNLRVAGLVVLDEFGDAARGLVSQRNLCPSILCHATAQTSSRGLSTLFWWRCCKRSSYLFQTLSPSSPPLQTRLILPSWLGIDTALSRAIAEGYGPTLSAMYREWPFFSSTVDLIEMILAKVRGYDAVKKDAVM